MNKSKKALFILNGHGLGNASRCSYIASLIEDSCDISFATFGQASWYLKERFSIDCIELSKFGYGGRGITGIIRTLYLFVFAFLKNTLILNRLIYSRQFDYIFCDSIYFLPLLKWRCLFSINNIVSLKVSEIRSVLTSKNFSQFFFVEIFDYLWNLSIYRKIIVPTFSSTSSLSRNRLYIGQCVEAPASDPAAYLYDVAILLGGSNLKQLFDLTSLPKNLNYCVIGEADITDENIVFLGRVFNRLDVLQQSKSVLINAGYSSISECLKLQKRFYIYPINNHFEQSVNLLRAIAFSNNASAFEGDISTPISPFFEQVDLNSKFILDKEFLLKFLSD